MRCPRSQLQNATTQLSDVERAARLEGKRLWLEVMGELEKVATFALKELDSMAAEVMNGQPGGSSGDDSDLLEALERDVAALVADF